MDFIDSMLQKAKIYIYPGFTPALPCYGVTFMLPEPIFEFYHLSKREQTMSIPQSYGVQYNKI